mgnify:FL=1|jgi:hypothetical protein
MFRTFLYGTSLFFTPLLAFAQTQGLVPCGFSTGNGANYYTSSTSCDLCSFGQLIQNIINYMVGISIPLAALLFAWAGILYFTSAGSPARVMRARKIFTSVFIGFLFVISAWLVVQTLLSTLVKGTVWFGGSWNSLQCTDPENRPRDKSISEWLGGIFSGGGTLTTGGQTSNPTGSSGQQTYTGASCANSSCSSTALTQAGYTQTQANVMSCIAMTESSGDPTRINSTSGACGTFQILPSNWKNPKLHQGDCSAATSCTDAYCNAQTAYLLSQNRVRAGQSPYADWTCPGCNNKAASCVQKYGTETASM